MTGEDGAVVCPHQCSLPLFLACSASWRCLVAAAASAAALSFWNSAATACKHRSRFNRRAQTLTKLMSNKFMWKQRQVIHSGHRWQLFLDATLPPCVLMIQHRKSWIKKTFTVLLKGSVDMAEQRPGVFVKACVCGWGKAWRRASLRPCMHTKAQKARLFSHPQPDTETVYQYKFIHFAWKIKPKERNCFFFFTHDLVCFHTNKPLHALSRALVSRSLKKKKTLSVKPEIVYSFSVKHKNQGPADLLYTACCFI